MIEIPEVPTVLLVDDDTRNLLALESVLDGEDYALVKARTADEALLALMDGEFAAVVLDVQMPDINGIDLARLIKQRKRTQNIPIIFLTAHYREEEHAMLGYDVGAVDYLTKPINSAVLRSKVNVFVDLFRKSRALTALNAQLEAQNIALQREAEERSRRIEAETARAEAEAANAAKDRFLAVLSHELRTPLTPIVYAVALLEMDAECPFHIREAIATIKKNVRLEARLIDDLLDLARIRSGKLTLKKETVDLHEILRDVVTLCFGESVQPKFHLVEEFAATETGVAGDSARLQQVFWNLLTNAAKFTSQDGTISIRTSSSNGWLSVEISDTGVGIEAQKLERIFDAFEQASQSGSAGLGLGLAICKALVEMHGGAIGARSDGPGRGSTFMVKLPCASVAKSAASFPDGDLPKLANVRVLLVEDHRDTAEILRQLLISQGCEVRIAGSIAEALEVAGGYAFDVLVSDIGLPDGRGTELLGLLRDKTERPIRAIAMSGFGMEDDLEISRHAGFAEHLIKPVEFSALQRALIHLVNGHEKFAANVAA